MKKGRTKHNNNEKFQISSVKESPHNLLDNTSIKSNAIHKVHHRSGHKNHLTNSELPVELESPDAQKSLRLHKYISSDKRKYFDRISNKRTVLAKDIEAQNTQSKKRKGKLANSIYDTESDIFQITKSASDSEKLKIDLKAENLVRLKRENKKSGDTNYLSSVFNCLTPVTLQAKSEKVQLPLLKRNYAKGDYNMSEEENIKDVKQEEVEEEVEIKAENVEEIVEESEGATDTGNEGEPVEPSPTEDVTKDNIKEEVEEEMKVEQEEEGAAVKEEGAQEETGSEQKVVPQTTVSPQESKIIAAQESSANVDQKEAVETERTKSPTTKQEAQGSNMSVPYTHSSVMKGLEKARHDATITTETIMRLKDKILSYQQKENLTKEDIMDMQDTQAELMEKLAMYGDTTKYISELVGMEEVPSSQLDMKIPPIPRKLALPRNDKATSASIRQIVGFKDKATLGPPTAGVSEVDDIRLQQYSEEKLPKVIVCGIGSVDQVPKLIVCEPIKRADTQPFQKCQKSGDQTYGSIKNIEQPTPLASQSNQMPQQMPQQMQQQMQQQMPQQMQQQMPQQMLQQMPPQGYGQRYPLEEQLADKQMAIENLHLVITTLQDDVQRLNEENIKLQRQMVYSSQPPQPKICRRELYQKVKKSLPPFERRNGDDTDQDMEQQISKLGEEVKNISKNLNEVQNKRCELDTQLYYFNSGEQPRCKLMLPVKETQTESESAKDKKLRLAEEQYRKLSKDFNKKVTEMAILKVELDKTKNEVENAKEVQNDTENSLQNALQYINKIESEKNKLLHFKEQYESMEQDADLAKQMYMTGQDELEESRSIFEDISNQLEDYRRKYLYTLSIIEEQKKDMDQKYLEHEEKVAAEIQRTRLRTQELEEELKNNKYLLQETQQKLKETQQMHVIALNNINDLSRDLNTSKKEIEKLRKALDKNKNKMYEEKIAALQENLRIAETTVENLESENEKLLTYLGRVQEAANENERQLEEKIHETKLLHDQMETLREESARQVSRCKTTFETMKTSMQTQISKMEAEVVQTRSAAYAAKQDKIAIQRKMQMQISQLTSTVNEAQSGVQSLQGHVTYLKGSFTSLLGTENPNIPTPDTDNCQCPPECHRFSVVKPELTSGIE